MVLLKLISMKQLSRNQKINFYENYFSCRRQITAFCIGICFCSLALAETNCPRTKLIKQYNLNKSSIENYLSANIQGTSIVYLTKEDCNFDNRTIKFYVLNTNNGQ